MSLCELFIFTSTYIHHTDHLISKPFSHLCHNNQTTKQPRLTNNPHTCTDTRQTPPHNSSCSFLVTLKQGCQTQLLEGRSPAEFCSNPAPTHKPCSFLISLKDLISWIRLCLIRVGAKLCRAPTLQELSLTALL